MSKFTLENFNDFRDLCHTNSVNCAWWATSERYWIKAQQNFDDAPDRDRYVIPTKLGLVGTEIDEAEEFYISGEYDDHLPHLLGAPVEFGDTIIRVADTAGYCKIDMNVAIGMVRGEFGVGYDGRVILWHEPGKDQVREMSAIQAIGRLHSFVARSIEHYRRGNMLEFGYALARIVVLSWLICDRNDWPLFDIAEEKIAYNSVRPDHKVEARAAKGGKIV